ncbi:MAG: MBL fold metallo-hydrolase [Rhodothermales bacterium]|nr:MBL fold metallo-hydrolase [Rhodothermales bacterium]
MEFVALGSTEAIGASCLFLNINDTGIVLDAGADPEEEGVESLPRLDLLRRNSAWYVDHVIVTHAHHDHMGSLPVLLREYPNVHVHMSPATRQLADLLLPASARLQRRKLKEGSSAHEPLFSEEELDMQSFLYLTHELHESFDLRGIKDKSPFRGEFYNAGHVLGSVGVQMTFEEEGRRRRVFYSSDTNIRPQDIIPGGDYPEGPIDILILESTLGADPEAEKTTRKLEEDRFASALARVLDRGGAVLIPVFALGRAQEMLAMIDRFKAQGRIPEDIPIYTAGSMRAVADLYDKTRLTTPRLDPEFQVYGVPQRRLPRSNEATRDALSQPSIHIMSSGMMFERTISNRLAQQLVESDKNGVFFVGFVKEDSPARMIIDAAANGQGNHVVLDRMVGPQPINCDVDRFRFSGHSNRRDLLQIVERLRPKQIVLVHGETEAREWMADNIAYFYPDTTVHLPECGQRLVL